MVPVYEFHDVEHRSCNWTGRVAGYCDGSGDTGIEGIETSSGARRRGVVMQTVWPGTLFFYGVEVFRRSSIASSVQDSTTVSDTEEAGTDSKIKLLSIFLPAAGRPECGQFAMMEYVRSPDNSSRRHAL